MKYAWAKPGQKVMLKQDHYFSPHVYNDKMPEQNVVYTLRDVFTTPAPLPCNPSTIVCRLVELVNPKHQYKEGITESWHPIEAFHPVYDLSIFTNMLNKVEA